MQGYKISSAMNGNSAAMMYENSGILHKTATLSVNGQLRHSPPEQYGYPPAAMLRQIHHAPVQYHHAIVGQQQQQQTRHRLSSTGETSADSSTTTSAASSYGEREDGSEGRAESDDADNDSDAGHVTEHERLQVESFFRGLKTQVYVCSSLANLYVSSAATNSDWELRYTGIPVVLLDAGETRSRGKRRIQILLAERGTCFTLWRDTIDNLSAYKVSAKTFHTMCLSSDHSQMIGFSFDTEHSALEMWSHIEQLVSCPENISLNAPGRKKKKKEKKPPKPAPLPPKSHISQPCCFQHVTSVDITDRNRYYSMQALVPSSADKLSRQMSTNEAQY